MKTIKNNAKNSNTTKERLLSSGAILICEKGYTGVSVREICKHANTSMNMIHHYFTNKEGLLNAITNSYGDNVFKFALKLLAKEPMSKEDFISRIELVFETTLEACIENRLVLMITIREQKSPAALMDYMTGFKAFIDIGIKKGFARQTLDSEMITGFILDRIVNQVQFAPWVNAEYGIDLLTDQNYIKRWAQSNVDVFINGIVN
ncbi:MAG: TetR/AcrR family transcriptional regulator [Saccharospirillaceae bacterium]|nr:TetR/AcrR family transcriptional regulator [Pseudomonadales bacterium]NRB78806.1 TetR/AcrR family transcriptional regulator [Saccharospirillaceae bacterium]